MGSGWWGFMWGVMDRSVMFWFICYTPVMHLANLFFLLTMAHFQRGPKPYPSMFYNPLCSKIQGLNLLEVNLITCIIWNTCKWICPVIFISYWTCTNIFYIIFYSSFFFRDVSYNNIQGGIPYSLPPNATNM